MPKSAYVVKWLREQKKKTRRGRALVVVGGDYSRDRRDLTDDTSVPPAAKISGSFCPDLIGWPRGLRSNRRPILHFCLVHSQTSAGSC